MSTMVSPIAGVSNVCSGVDQRKHQSSASLAFVMGIHRRQSASNAENASIWWRHHDFDYRSQSVRRHYLCFLQNWYLSELVMAIRNSVLFFVLKVISGTGILIQVLTINLAVFRKCSQHIPSDDSSQCSGSAAWNRSKLNAPSQACNNLNIMVFGDLRYFIHPLSDNLWITLNQTWGEVGEALTTWLFVQTNNKPNINRSKLHITSRLWGEPSGDHWINFTKGQWWGKLSYYIPWRHMLGC